MLRRTNCCWLSSASCSARLRCRASLRPASLAWFARVASASAIWAATASLRASSASACCRCCTPASRARRRKGCPLGRQGHHGKQHENSRRQAGQGRVALAPAPEALADADTPGEDGPIFDESFEVGGEVGGCAVAAGPGRGWSLRGRSSLRVTCLRMWRSSRRASGSRASPVG